MLQPESVALFVSDIEAAAAWCAALLSSTTALEHAHRRRRHLRASTASVHVHPAALRRSSLGEQFKLFDHFNHQAAPCGRYFLRAQVHRSKQA